MIPRILHQTAKTAQISPRWAPLQAKLLELHPGWEYHLWTDADNEALLEERRPDLLPLYHGLPRPVMRADLMRYVYMHLFGGFYLDTDYQMLKPFDLLEGPLVLPRESEDLEPVYLGNAVFASVPGHPYWDAVLERLKGDPPTADATKIEHDVIDRTGPGFLTAVWKDGFQNDDGIVIPPRAWFHPPTPEEDGALASILSNKETYGIHWCFGSWRALTLWARLKDRVKKWLGSNR